MFSPIATVNFIRFDGTVEGITTYDFRDPVELDDFMVFCEGIADGDYGTIGEDFNVLFTTPCARPHLFSTAI